MLSLLFVLPGSTLRAKQPKSMVQFYGKKMGHFRP